jgi:hypothetical protein
MKHLFVQLCATIALLSVFSFHCQGADKYTLEYKLEAGKTYKQFMVSKSIIKMNAMGQDINMDMKMDMDIQYDVKGKTADGYDILLTFQKIKTEITGGPTQITFDSDSPENSTVKEAGEILKSFTTTPLNIHITKQGKVTSVEGVDKLVEKLNTTSNEQIKQMLGQQFSEKAIQSTIEKMSSFFPDQPVAIGDSWDVNTSVNSGGADVISKMTLTLKEVNNNVAMMEFTGTITTPEGGSIMKVNGMDAKVSMTGDQTGTIQVSMSTGWITLLESVVNATMNMEIMGQTVVQKMEMKTTVTGE